MGCISWCWNKFKVDPNWLKEVRGHLITAATLMATMAYQSILSPPGGFWQETKLAPSPSSIDPLDQHTAGEAIMDNSRDGSYGTYLVLNTIVLGTSLSTIMLAMTGFPMDNKFLTWLLVFTVYITLSCMAGAYMIAINLVSKKQISDDALIGLSIGWICICVFVMVLHLCRFLVWLGDKLLESVI
ncbi:uncharacterized protein LOC131321085 [Rhododendron vialii]|uniref:uncharacterized protein LOC131321085 n=1 Tax=Rhododendron vialii TaxID=182163 RepID=UPI00265E121F|nr:uncharacterized protein LOC131321085 [Rhododendron vialii]